MRPTRLELEGFTAFRKPTVVDFDGADLFALSGPTGSGKSSLVDAMVFALYGTVPRLDRRAVAPVISLGAPEAKVRLDFAVGQHAYTAVRVVRRTKTGATTKEARLEQAGGGVLGGNADEVTSAVTELLGLSYEHFVKCVVLPQGDFAAFLHDTGAERQGLLVKLLDLGLYERMAAIARSRESEATRVADRLDGELHAVAGATRAAVADAAERLAQLEKLTLRAEEWAARLADLDREAAEAARAGRDARADADRLAATTVPPGVADRAARLAEARAAAVAAESSHARAASDLEVAEAKVGALPNRAELEAAVRGHSALADRREQRAKGTAALAEADAAVTRAGEELSAAREAAAAAASALDTAQWRHRAHDLRSHLSAGEPCPVCRQTVDAVPAVDGDDDPDGAEGLARARAAKRDADTRLEQAADRHAEAARHQAGVQTKLATVAEQVEQLESEVTPWPDPTELAARLAEVAEAEAAVQATRVEARRLAREAGERKGTVSELETALADDLAAFDQARDAVAALGPPPADRADLGRAWAALATWAANRLPDAMRAVEAAEHRARRCTADATATREAAAEALAGAGLHADDREIRDPMRVVAAAKVRAEAEHERLQRDLLRAGELRGKAADARRRADLSRALGRHLSARGFEKWILDEALAELTVAATEILRTLSRGAYSLSVDERGNFAVIDHRNADEPRSARTLSGGETFLASLALALALADQVSSLAAGGAARLESIFLDEGFGSLDPDTLDTVASAIEELGAGGRMVGLISHVAELAERVPARFLVTRDPAGSQVTKVVA